MHSTLFFLVLAAGDFSLSLDHLGFFENIQFYRAEDQYVIIARNEGGIGLVDLDGKLLYRYQQPGQGPLELQYPFLLGWDEDRILLASNDRNLVSFDFQLNPEANPFPPLPASISAKVAYCGLQRAPRTFLLILSGLSSAEYLVLEMEFGGAWVQKAAYFKQREPRTTNMETKNLNYRINPHAGRIFKTTFVADDAYEVSVHLPPVKPGEDGETVQILQQSTEDFPKLSPWYRATMSDSMKTPNGYAVIFWAREVGRKEPEPYVDTFEENGNFLRRLRLESSPIPCANCGEIWILGEGVDGGEAYRQWDAPVRANTSK